MGGGLSNVDDRHRLDIRLLHLRGIGLKGAQLLVYDGTDVDKYRG